MGNVKKLNESNFHLFLDTAKISTPFDSVTKKFSGKKTVNRGLDGSMYPG
jgi:hypothetical protein